MNAQKIVALVLLAIGVAVAGWWAYQKSRSLRPSSQVQTAYQYGYEKGDEQEVVPQGPVAPVADP